MLIVSRHSGRAIIILWQEVVCIDPGIMRGDLSIFPWKSSGVVNSSVVKFRDGTIVEMPSDVSWCRWMFLVELNNCVVGMSEVLDGFPCPVVTLWVTSLFNKIA